MPFNYIIKWRRTHPEKVSVEAYHKYPQKKEEKHKPAFIIGHAEGGRLLAIRHKLEEAAKASPTRKRGNILYIMLDGNDESAYRIGLAAAMLSRAKTSQEVEKAAKYVLNITAEEVWFWTSKYLEEDIQEKALESLAVISGVARIAKATDRNKSD